VASGRSAIQPTSGSATNIGLNQIRPVARHGVIPAYSNVGTLMKLGLRDRRAIDVRELWDRTLKPLVWPLVHRPLLAAGAWALQEPWPPAVSDDAESAGSPARPALREGLLTQVKRLIVGSPIPSHLAHRERLSRFTGVAVLSSDRLSSVAYATEEILRVLILVGVGALTLATPIALVIAAILAIAVFSYRQTIHTYPGGGGAYIVGRLQS
jgi:hypothetical protein